MTSTRKRLGRGLDALLGGGDSQAVDAAREDSLRTIPIERLQRGKYQPRTDMRQDSLADLAASIVAQGVVQPIVVRPIEKDGDQERYEIVAGERRWRAAQLAELREIPAVVKEVGDEDAIALALIENIQRENLNPLEESRALDRLIREFDLTHAQAASAVGRSRASVSNLLRLQDLSEKVKVMVEDRKIDMGHARALLGVENALQQYDIARQVIRKGLSVRQTERLVKRALSRGDETTGGSADLVDIEIERRERELGQRLGANVQLQHNRKGSGRVVIRYDNLDELDQILTHIR